MEKIRPFLSNVTCEKYVCDSGYVCDFSKSPRPEYVISFMLKGKATFITENSEFTITEGDVLFIPLGECYISKWEAEYQTECFSFHFRIKNSDSPFFNKSTHIQGIYNCEYLKETFITVEKQINSNNPLENIAGFGNFYILFSQIYEKLELTHRISDHNIQIAHTYINEHYKEKINIEHLAELCNLSVPNFYRKFKSAYHSTPVTYKNLLLTEKAIELLISHPEKSIEKISDELGFESAVYFRKLFKKTTGKTPLEYRKTGIKI